MIDLDFQGLCFWCDCLIRISYQGKFRLKLPPCIIVHDLQKTLSSIDWRWTSYNKQDGFRKWRIFALIWAVLLFLIFLTLHGLECKAWSKTQSLTRKPWEDTVEHLIDPHPHGRLKMMLSSSPHFLVMCISHSIHGTMVYLLTNLP